MDKEQLLEVIPHYVAMLAVLFFVLILIRLIVGDVGVWIELLIAFGVAVVYRPVVKRLGVAPSAWED